MPVEYVLRENKLTQEENDFMANVVTVRRADIEDIISRMIERGSTVTEADIVSVLKDFTKALQSLLAEGANVTTPFANFSSSIRGVFDGAQDVFDPSRHQLTSIVNPGKEIRAFYRSSITTQKNITIDIGPILVTFEDSFTGEINSVLSPGNIGKIIGNKLDFDMDDAKQGVFFIAEDGLETKVEIYGQKRPSVLVFHIPESLASGDYTLEVRDKPGRTLRKGRLKYTLSVAGGSQTQEQNSQVETEEPESNVA